MPQKKNPFLNFCFSCWPGAGQMYQGFVKKGASIMTIFCGILFFTGLFDMDALLVAIPIVWFYGFFDSVNTNSLSDEKFASLKDEFLFVDNSFNTRQILKKFRFPVGVLLVFIGIYWICRSSLYALAGVGFIHWYSRAFELLNYIPKTFMALGVIVIGVCLITGRWVQYDGEKRMQYDAKREEGEQQMRYDIKKEEGEQQMRYDVKQEDGGQEWENREGEGEGE